MKNLTWMAQLILHVLANSQSVTTLLENPKRRYAEVKLCLSLFMPALEIVCRAMDVFKAIGSS